MGVCISLSLILCFWFFFFGCFFQVPFGKAAFFPGRLVHTNEFLVIGFLFDLMFEWYIDHGLVSILRVFVWLFVVGYAIWKNELFCFMFCLIWSFEWLMDDGLIPNYLIVCCGHMSFGKDWVLWVFVLGDWIFFLCFVWFEIWVIKLLYNDGSFWKFELLMRFRVDLWKLYL